MSKKQSKFYSVHGECTDKYGDKHTVTLVGKVDWVKEHSLEVNDKRDSVGNETVTSKFSYTKKKRLTVGMAICHKLDAFDLEVGKELAKSRIKRGEHIGYIEGVGPMMLSRDSIMSELLVMLSHVTKYIEQFIPKREEGSEVKYRVEDGVYNMAGASCDDILKVAGTMKDDEKILIDGGKELRKEDVKKILMNAMAQSETEAGDDNPETR